MYAIGLDCWCCGEPVRRREPQELYVKNMAGHCRSNFGAREYSQKLSVAGTTSAQLYSAREIGWLIQGCKSRWSNVSLLSGSGWSSPRNTRCNSESTQNILMTTLPKRTKNNNKKKALQTEQVFSFSFWETVKLVTSRRGHQYTWRQREWGL